ncbi:MAG: hypothetical protein AMJ54_15570 [Deltaproteobacteria bacterium SG8_13]|nr:MAG: hypothetical protein AMJ54_15570 [Deltaproteobacteria bacterium SG8_13]
MKTEDLSSQSKRYNNLLKAAKRLSVSAEELGTLLDDIVPMLKRKLDLMNHQSPGNNQLEKDLATVMDKELPKVLANYGLEHIKSNKNVMLFVVKQIVPDITDLRIKKIVDRSISHSDQNLADQLAAELGIRDEHIQHFKSSVLPKLKKHTKSMYRNKVGGGGTIEDPEGFNKFIIENVFIDEFENHVYIRSATDEKNRAILLPEANAIVYQMLEMWMNEVVAEKPA